MSSAYLRASCSTITWQSVDTDERFIEILHSIKEIGYTGVEIEYRLLPPNLKNKPELLLNLVQASGLEISSVSLVDTASVRDFVRRVGTKTATLCLFEKDFKTAELKTKNLLRNLSQVVVAAHPHIRSNLETQDQLVALMKSCKPLTLGVCFDTAHTIALGIDPIPYLDRFSESIAHVHLKNLKPRVSGATLDVTSDFVDLEDGSINLKPITEALKRLGYKGWISVEVDYPQNETPETSARKNYKKLMQLMNQ